MSIRSLADFNWNSLGGAVTVGAITVTAQANSSGLTRRQGNGDFYLATSGDLQMATSGDFLMATDTRSCRPRSPELWQLFARYPFMTRLRDRAVLDHGLTQQQSFAWQHDGFALADGYDDATSRFRGLILPTDNRKVAVTDDTLIVKPTVAQEQREREEAETQDQREDKDQRDRGEEEEKEPDDKHVQPPPPAKTRFFGSKVLSPDRYGLDFKKLADEVLAHLASAPGVKLEIRVEIEASAPDGFDDAKLRTISENADTLKFDAAEFE